MSAVKMEKILTNVDGTFAWVCFDSEFDEWSVKFYRRGLFLRNATYYGADEDDAHSAARAELLRMFGVECIQQL